MSYTREILRKRHRLSQQQIDSWLNENRSKEFLVDKMRQLKMVQHFITVTDLLYQNKIDFTCLKGPLLSQRIYNDPSVRFSHDIDLLIDEQQIGSTISVFLKNGYDFAEGAYWPQHKTQQELILNNCHHISFYHPTLKFCVEVHWVLMYTLPLSAKRIKKIVLENQSTIVFSGREFKVLNPELELLYLLIHGTRHGWERLKWLVDIKDYPFEKLEIENFIKLVKLFKAERIIGQTNFLLQKFFHQELPKNIAQKSNQRLNAIALEYIESENVIAYSNEEVKRVYLNYYLMFPGLFYKCKIIFRILFRPDDIKEINSSFKWVYYFYRPYSFIKRRIFHA